MCLLNKSKKPAPWTFACQAMATDPPENTTEKTVPSDGSFGSRLCENSDAVLESRICISISEPQNPAALPTFFREAAAEKTILNEVRPGTFSHSLGH